MAVITRYRVQLGGFTGAPGVNTHWALQLGELTPSESDADEYAELLMGFYTGIRQFLAVGVTCSLVPIAEHIDVATGNLVGASGVSAPTVTSSAATSSPVSRATQVKIRALSDRIIGNRFLRGGIFLGPIDDIALSPAGAVQDSVRTAVIASYGGLLDIVGMRAALYSAPNPARVGNPEGQFGYIQSVDVAPLPASLRSRRD